MNLALLKECIMKFESGITDLHELMEDADLSPEAKMECGLICETACCIEARLLNMVKRECGDEDDFLNTEITMDSIDPFPGDDIAELDNILDASIE